MDLTIILSTDVQNWHDCNALQLPNSTAQCEQIGMSYHHDSCIRRFLLLPACTEVSTGSVEASKAKHGQHRLPVYTEEYLCSLLMA
jgi:hypothetical protein